MGDCHLGGWRQPELMELNLKSFQHTIDVAIKERVDFVLIAGDLFDSAYPPIEVLKEAFKEFKKLYDANIPAFFIAGSHDYSVSGKSFLDVLEKTGFAKNAHIAEERNGAIILHPIVYKGAAVYGFPGRRSGLEVEDISKIKLDDAPGLFRILMLHTAIRDAVGTLPIPAVDHEKLPKVDYVALAHLHIQYNKNGRVYCGPLFPNNALELEELQGGSFYMVDTSGKIERREIRLKEVCIVDCEITSTVFATEKILEQLKKHILKNKIVILRLKGTIEQGKMADLHFNEIEDYTKSQEAYVLLKNVSKLSMKEPEIEFTVQPQHLEEEILKRYQNMQSNEFNKNLVNLFQVLQIEKKEEERIQIFEERLFDEISKIISL
jgi:DNA repair exonuclease SbcCD nuclease subunit